MKNQEPTQTNWYVITGGPCSGKSTTIRELEKQGYTVKKEIARAFLDEQKKLGKTKDDVRKNEEVFQKTITGLKIRREDSLNENEMLFFDVGLAEDVAFRKQYGYDNQDVVDALQKRRYKKIFYMEKIAQYEIDDARTESAELAQSIHDDMYKAYEDLGYEIVRVPVMSVVERVELILSHAVQTVSA